MNVNTRGQLQRQKTSLEEITQPINLAGHQRPNKLSIYAANHLSALLASCGKLTRTPIATLMTLIVIAIALMLPTSLFVLLQNAKQVTQNWNESAQISLYLKMDVSPEQAEDLVNQLKHQSGISAVKYISPQEGLAQFQNQADVQAALADLNENPLPGVIQIQPDDTAQTPDSINHLVASLKDLPQIDTAQLDMQWLNRLYAIINLSKDIVFALGTLLAVGVLFIIGHTIHLSLQKYQREIEIFKLVGATDSFIRRPFLYTGMLYGLGGSLLAWLLVTILILSLSPAVHQLSNLYNSNFSLQGLSFAAFTKLLCLGVGLGLIGAWLAVGKHLRNTSQVS